MSIAGSRRSRPWLLLTSQLTTAQMTEFGWRIPFVIGAALGLAGLFVRRFAHEAELPSEVTAESTADHLDAASPFVPASHPDCWRDVTLPVDAAWCIPRDGDRGGVSSSQAFAANTVGLLVMMMLLPVFAMASDRFGRRKVLGGGLFAQAVVVVPALFVLETNPSLVILIQIVVAIPAAAIEGALLRNTSSKFRRAFAGSGWAYRWRWESRCWAALHHWSRPR